MKTALWWIRRDLRLSDNQALMAALNHADQVLPIFILDPSPLSATSTGEKRLAFLEQQQWLHREHKGGTDPRQDQQILNLTEKIACLPKVAGGQQ